MDLGLEGKVALVSAGGVGIGKAVCLALAREGAYVAVNDLPKGSPSEQEWISRRGGQKLEDVLGKETAAMIGDSRAENVAAECRKFGVRSISAEADVTNLEQVEGMVKKTLKEFGKIDILVNVAGASGGPEDFVKNTKAKWDFIINLCLYSCIYCCKAVLPHMVDHSYGKIVNFLSDAWKGADRGMAVYGATKAAISSLTRTLAVETGRYGINVNAVSPGSVATEWKLESLKHDREQMGEEAFNEMLNKQFRFYPLARFYKDITQPEDVANLVLFLCSDRARWITGQSISISGGYHMH